VTLRREVLAVRQLLSARQCVLAVIGCVAVLIASQQMNCSKMERVNFDTWQDYRIWHGKITSPVGGEGVFSRHEAVRAVQGA